MKKKIISAFVIFTFSLILCVSFSMGKNNDIKNNVANSLNRSTCPTVNKLNSNIKNIALSIFYNSSSASSDTDYKKLITYVDSSGNQTSNVFMDTFVFVPGASYIPKTSTTNILGGLKIADIDTYLDDELKQMRAVNDEVAKINDKKGTSIKVNAFMSIQILSNAKNEEGIKLFVDKSIAKFKESNLSNINLVGFYWNIESVSTTEVEKLMRYFTKYVRQLGYESLWVPYIPNYNNVATGETYAKDLYRNGYCYGYDFVSIQSGYYFHGDDDVWLNYRSGVKRLDFSNTESKKLGMSVEFEADSEIYMGPHLCSRLKDFMTAAVKNKWNNDVNVYYFPGFINTPVNNEFTRSLYDLTYKYANNTLTISDINALSCDKSYYSNYENVSKGKKYTTVVFEDSSGTPIYVNGTDGYKKYRDDGLKLTDGMYGETVWSTLNEWVGFNRRIDSSNYYATIDLGGVTKSLTYFATELNANSTGGIGLPGSIKVYVSNDNVNFTNIGSLSLNKSNSKFFKAAYYDLKLIEPVSARYVKFVFDKGSSSFVFVSEVVVGKTSTISLSSNSSKLSLYGGSKTITINTDNVGTLEISNTNDNVVDVKYSGNQLVLTPKKVGNSVIKVVDSKYKTVVTHNVEVSNTIESISISSLPKKTTYFVGEQIDLDGGKIQVNFSGGHTEILSMSDKNVKVSGFNSSKVQTLNITLEYEKKKTSFTMNIVKNNSGSAYIAIIDKQSGLSLSGVEFQIKNTKNEVIGSWVSNGNVHIVEGLSPDEKYTLVVNKVPDGYKPVTNSVFELSTDKEGTTLQMEIIPIQVEVFLKDSKTEEAIVGANFILTDMQGNVFDTWVSEDEPHILQRIPVGKYLLTQTSSLDNYSFDKSARVVDVKFENELIVITNTLTDELEDSEDVDPEVNIDENNPQSPSKFNMLIIGADIILVFGIIMIIVKNKKQ